MWDSTFFYVDAIAAPSRNKYLSVDESILDWIWYIHSDHIDHWWVVGEYFFSPEVLGIRVMSQ